MAKVKKVDKFPDVNGNLGAMMQTIQAMDKLGAGGIILADAYTMLDALCDLGIIRKSDVRHMEDALECVAEISNRCAEIVNEFGKMINKGEMKNEAIDKAHSDQDEGEEEVTEDGYRIHDTSEEDFAKWLADQLKGGKD